MTARVRFPATTLRKGALTMIKNPFNNHAAGTSPEGATSGWTTRDTVPARGHRLVLMLQ